MEWAALVSWILTAGGGFVLLSIWIGRGGMRRQHEPGSRIRTPLIFSHLLLAATGLVLWIAYVFSDSDALAWIAFAALLVVAVLGWTMFAIWWRRRQADAGVAVPASGGIADPPAEQQFPVAIVGVHGLLAVTTVVLVLLAAAGVGS